MKLNVKLISLLLILFFVGISFATILQKRQSSIFHTLIKTIKNHFFVIIHYFNLKFNLIIQLDDVLPVQQKEYTKLFLFCIIFGIYEYI